jgi:hypothetical protein
MVRDLASVNLSEAGEGIRPRYGGDGTTTINRDGKGLCENEPTPILHSQLVDAHVDPPR